MAEHITIAPASPGVKGLPDDHPTSPHSDHFHLHVPHLIHDHSGARAPSRPPSSVVHDVTELQLVQRTLAHVSRSLDSLRSSLPELTQTSEVYTNIKRQQTLQKYIKDLEEKELSLLWREIARTRPFGFSPDRMQSILKDCKDIGNTTSVIAAFSATISITILFSAVRGNLMYFFAAWWCSIISLVCGLGLAVVGSSSSSARRSLTGRDWWRVHFSGFMVALCLLSAVGGVIGMCYGVVFLNVFAELQGGDPHLTDGPSLPQGQPVPQLIVASIIICFICGGAFFALFFGPFRFARQRHWERLEALEEEKAMTPRVSTD